MTNEQLSGKAIGGKARIDSMTPAQRKDMAQKGALAKAEIAKLPKAEYEGRLKIGDIDLDVAVLGNKQRIITLTAAFKAFDRPIRGNSRLINTPAFMDAKNLQPFVDEGLRGVINKVQYVNLSGKMQEGYDALIIPLVSDLYLKARENGALSSSQIETAQKSEILIRSLAKVGIVALVDEATGYQKDRAKDALAKIMEAFVAKELQPWVRTFPAEYYEQLFRLYGIPFPPEKTNWRPQFFGNITNEVVYRRLAPDLLPELKKAATKSEKKVKLHQWLTNDAGHPKLREHLASITTILKLSANPEQFKQMVDQIHPRFGDTVMFKFD